MNFLYASTVINKSVTGSSGDGMDFLSHAIGSGGVVFFVLLILLFFSLTSWSIIIWKYFELRRAKSLSYEFLDYFWKSQSLNQLYESFKDFSDSPVGEVFLAGFRQTKQLMDSSKEDTENGLSSGGSFELSGIESVERALHRSANQQIGNLERLLTFLATTASATPFIGLFGTVWGIMNAFRDIGLQGSAGLAVVAPGISEALVATALGLAAAIPAVIAYNHYQNRIKVITNEMENFISDFLNLVQRHF
ncbi:MAG: protein TolQ [Nitrospinota bacterium]|nr:protein TolQ [Nitrospinota bacterium]